MKFTLAGIVSILVTLTSVVADTQVGQPAELKVETTFMPAECPLKAKTGSKISMHYTGKLFSNGNKFDSSRDRGQPLPFTLGVGQVIPGWDEGLQGMCLGEKRILTIPSRLAYGSRGFGDVIPENSALVFDVELMDLEGGEPVRDEL